MVSVVSVGGYNQVSQEGFQAIMAALNQGKEIEVPFKGRTLVVTGNTTGKELKEFLNLQ